MENVNTRMSGKPETHKTCAGKGKEESKKSGKERKKERNGMTHKRIAEITKQRNQRANEIAKERQR